MRKIFICSPYVGNLDMHGVNTKDEVIKKHLTTARLLCSLIVSNKYLPIAPHIYFTQFLNDQCLDDRKLGCSLGQIQLLECEAVIVYRGCCGISSGMEAELVIAVCQSIPIIEYKKREGGILKKLDDVFGVQK